MHYIAPSVGGWKLEVIHGHGRHSSLTSLREFRIVDEVLYFSFFFVVFNMIISIGANRVTFSSCISDLIMQCSTKLQKKRFKIRVDWNLLLSINSAITSLLSCLDISFTSMIFEKTIQTSELWIRRSTYRSLLVPKVCALNSETCSLKLLFCFSRELK